MAVFTESRDFFDKQNLANDLSKYMVQKASGVEGGGRSTYDISVGDGSKWERETYGGISKESRWGKLPAVVGRTLFGLDDDSRSPGSLDVCDMSYSAL